MAPMARGARAARLLLAAWCCGCLGSAGAAVCPGRIDVRGHGPVSLIPAGWHTPGIAGAVEVLGDGSLLPHLRGRAYFADACSAGVYDRQHYLALELLGKTLRYTTDLSGAGCGCNAGLYLVPLRHNDQQSWCRDYYCDANKLCGVSCAEIDIQEANQHAWHSTLHAAHDHNGLAGGIGGEGTSLDPPHDWSNSQYSPGSACIDTSKPFQVAASFPVDAHGSLLALEVTLSQEGHSCSLSTQVRGYAGLPELSAVLAAGVTPVVSYWSSNNMRWLDGTGYSGRGPCANDTAAECQDFVRFYGFSVEAIAPAGAGGAAEAGRVAGKAVPTAREAAQQAAPAAREAAQEAGRGAQPAPACPGSVPLEGYGRVSLVPAGWQPFAAAAPSGRAAAAAEALEVRHGQEVVPHLGSRGYFADTCEAGNYNRWQYVALDLLGKRLRYTTDLSGVGCGCNAALYLIPMRHNTEASKCGDFYCDASSLCGISCSELVVQESDRLSWRSTLRSPGGGSGTEEGLRPWNPAEYAPGAGCVDTSKPFEVTASFPLDAAGQLAALEVQLEQGGRSCKLSARLGKHTDLRNFSKALTRGVTPVVSYWSSDDSLLSDSPDEDQRVRCGRDGKPASGADAKCGASAKFYGFSIESLALGRAPATTPAPAARMEPVPEASKEASEEEARLEAGRADVAEAVGELMAEAAKADALEESKPRCPGSIEFPGHGRAALVPTGWAQPGGGAKVEVKGGKVVPHMGARAYFAESCSAGVYERERYLALNLLGKTLHYTTDMSGAGCGCNAALYLVSMRQNPRPSECYDYYCDANNVCGESCDEIDIQEGNQFAWHSTLHTWKDHNGFGGGYGGGGKEWSGPRDWSSEQYGPGSKCIDTNHPFQVAASFPKGSDGALAAMEVRLSQEHGSPCSLHKRIEGYAGLSELSAALSLGMTPVVSYWSSNDMLWMDGVGKDGKGICARDNATACGEAVRFSNFSLEDMAETPKLKSAAKAADGSSEAGSSAHGPGFCPGAVHIAGHGRASLVPAGGIKAGQASPVKVLNGREVVPVMGGRAYFADSCSPDAYKRESYVGWKLLGKTLRYTTDVSKAGMSASGCGCNAAFYLVAMRQNKRPGSCHDYYCDANGACGESCAEIDVQKANKFAWHSTVHGAKDHTGLSVQGGGFDWNGPRAWSSSQYAPGAKCIDTAQPFQVAVSFPVDNTGALVAVEVNLTQASSSCSLAGRIHGYADMPALSAALAEGMTPVVSYFSSSDNLLMSGAHLEPCNDGTAKCGDAVKFYDISVEDLKRTEAKERSGGDGPLVIKAGEPAKEAAHKVMAALIAMQKREAEALRQAQASMAQQRQREAEALQSREAAKRRRAEHTAAEAAEEAQATAKVAAAAATAMVMPSVPGAAMPLAATAAAQQPPLTATSTFAELPKVAAAGVVGGTCGQAFKQCGGSGWTQSSCCLTGCRCQPKSLYYSQCIPLVPHAETCAAAAALAAAGPALQAPVAAPAAAVAGFMPPAQLAAGGGGLGAFGQAPEELLIRKTGARRGRVDPLVGRLARSRWLAATVAFMALLAIAAAGVLMRKRAWRGFTGALGTCDPANKSPQRVLALKYSQLPSEAQLCTKLCNEEQQASDVAAVAVIQEAA